jgi:hypothetical protein
MTDRPALDPNGHVHDLRIFADYHQFYIWDAGTNPLAPVDYTDDDLRNMMKVLVE